MSTWHWIIVLIVVLVVFGTKRLTNGLGNSARDVGKAINEFKKGMHGEEGERNPSSTPSANDSRDGDSGASQPRQDDQAPR